MKLALLTFVLWTALGVARPVNRLSFEELQAQSDVILLMEVLNLEEADPQTEVYRYPFIEHVAHCRVVSVFKGDCASETLDIRFAQSRDGSPGFNGARPAPFLPNRDVRYLAYLKRNQDGALVPLTGAYEAGLSIKLVLKDYDHRHVEFPITTKTNAHPRW